MIIKFSKSVDRSKISVIIPLYNGEEFILDCLSSVISQTVRAHEIIVVNDGSEDRSVELIQNSPNFSHIKIIQKFNGGQSSARNLGAAQANGHYLAFLDQDDIWYPNHLELLLKAILRSGDKVGYAFGNLDRISRDGNLVETKMLDKVYQPRKHLIDCIGRDMFILPSASLIVKSVFQQIGGFDERLSGYEDDDLFLRLFRAGYTGAFVNVAIGKWRIYAGSTSYSPRMAKSRMIYFHKLLELYPNDRKLNEFWTRDIIAPRFIRTLVGRFRIAAINSDHEAMKKIWLDIKALLPHILKSHSWKIRVLSPLMEVSLFFCMNRAAVRVMELAGW